MNEDYLIIKSDHYDKVAHTYKAVLDIDFEKMVDAILTDRLRSDQRTLYKSFYDTMWSDGSTATGNVQSPRSLNVNKFKADLNKKMRDLNIHPIIRGAVCEMVVELVRQIKYKS